ncbi:PAS-domain containing protein [Nisaea nitritireducens]|uniref:PAS-domain containing protein n=1 Tax=Nisaea nitritireducens TaxID=568392 RepID=UPI00186833E2|nr:PAS-domain containing protein [Nisaea nitritireducens]
MIENVSQGLTYFDQDLNLVVCNRRYLDMLGFPHDLGIPGTPIAAFFRINAERGEYGPGRIEDLVNERLAMVRQTEAHSFEPERPDGTILRITRTPVDGGGFVTTYDDITELRKSQKALEQSNERLDELVLERTAQLQKRETDLSAQTEALETTLEAVNYGITLFDRNLHLVAANRLAFDMMRIPQDLNRPGTPFGALARVLAERGEYGPGDIEKLVQERVDLAQRFDHLRYTREQSNGKIYEIWSRPVENGFVATYVDVTEQKQLEALLRANNEELVEKSSALETILETLDYGISLFDRELNLVAANPQAFNLMAVPHHFNQPGRHFTEFLRYQAGMGEFGEGDIDEIVERHATAAAGPESYTSIRQRKNGMIIEVNRRPIENGFVATYRDVTDEKRLEALLRSTNEELETRVEERTSELNAQLRETERAEAEMRKEKSRAELADKAKSDFLARMSHEIRTPLNGVIGLNRILADTELTERQADIVAKVRSSSNALLSVVNDVLDFAKIEAGQLDIEEIPFKLSDVLDSVTSIAATRAEEKGLAFEVISNGTENMQFLGDPFHIGQILTNYCSNAVKFTDTGYVRLAVTFLPEIHGINQVRFSVSDSGIGMDKDIVERIFVPFHQADASTTRQFGGTGLGLAICRELAHSMNGEVWVESQPNHGSTFHVDLPLPTVTDESAIPLGGERDWRAACEGLQVLLVEDNAINREIATVLLEGAGVTVTSAEHGKEAVDIMLTEAPPKIDAVLMDLQMPVMDGHEATRLILADPRHHDLKIIALTAHAVAEEIEKCRNAGMCRHITKPFEPNTLFRHLAECSVCAGVDCT